MRDRGRSRYPRVVVVLAVKLAVLYGVVTIGPVMPVCQAGVPCYRPPRSS